MDIYNKVYWLQKVSSTLRKHNVVEHITKKIYMAYKYSIFRNLFYRYNNTNKQKYRYKDIFHSIVYSKENQKQYEIHKWKKNQWLPFLKVK